MFTKLISNVVHVNTNKDSQALTTVLTIHLAKKFLNDVTSFHLFQITTQHYVAGKLLTASYGLTEPYVVGIVASLQADRAQCSRHSG